MSKTEKVKHKIPKEDLRKAVDEVNEQLELTPPIEKGKRKQMKKDIRDVMGDKKLFEGREEFSKETYKVFERMGIKHDVVKIKTEKKGVEEMATKTKKKKTTVKSNGKKTKTNEHKLTRGEGVFHGITGCKKGKTFNEIVDDVFVYMKKKTPKSSIVSYLRVSLSTLERFSMVEQKEGKYFFISK